MLTDVIQSMAYDGLDALCRILKCDGGLASHMVKSTLFFRPEQVALQAEKMLLYASGAEKLPVRFSSRKSAYKTSTGNIRVFQNKAEAVRNSESEDINASVRPGIRIRIDKDGNYWVRRAIKEYTGEKVSTGTISTIKNYMISHIWGCTDDPFYFTALWNIALIPLHCSFVLDKQTERTLHIKALYKAICWELYRPDLLLGIDFPEIPAEEYVCQARKCIDNGMLNLIPDNDIFSYNNL